MCDNELLMEHCHPMAEGAEPLSGHDLEHLLSHVDGWELDGKELVKSFQFPDHYQTMAFVNAVAWISHREDHHPDLHVGYNTCGIRYSTHSIGGLSRNDFVCAARVDALLAD